MKLFKPYFISFMLFMVQTCFWITQRRIHLVYKPSGVI